jgi:hypothetical protein
VHRACASDSLSLLVPSIVPLQSRTSTVRRLLEPLLEGLAQFAEFDLYSGSSSAASSLTSWTLAIFGRDADIPIALENAARLNALLARMRLDDLVVRRKADMLVRPLTAGRGGYLIGYLAVKNLWQVAQRHSNKLRDPDLFFTYLRSLVFGDYGLVQMLLAPPADEYVDLNNLTGRLHTRLKLMRCEDLDDHVQAFEEAVTGGRDIYEQCDCLFLDAETVKASRSVYTKRCKFQEEGDGEERRRGSLSAGVPVSDLAAQLNRSMIRIRVDEVVVEIGKGHICKVKTGDNLLFEVSSFPEIAQGVVSGWLSIHFLPTYLSLAVVCSSEAGAVFAIFIACSDSIAIPEQIQRGYAEAMSRVVRDEAVRGILHEAIESDDFENMDNIGFEDVVPKVTPAITNLYLNHALCFVSDEKVGGVQEMMRRSGFWDVLSRTGDAPHQKTKRIEGLAALGLLRTFIADEAMMAQLMEQKGFSFEEVVANLAVSSAEHGYLLGIQPTSARIGEKAPAFWCLV